MNRDKYNSTIYVSLPGTRTSEGVTIAAGLTKNGALTAEASRIIGKLVADNRFITLYTTVNVTILPVDAITEIGNCIEQGHFVGAIRAFKAATGRGLPELRDIVRKYLPEDPPLNFDYTAARNRFLVDYLIKE